MMGKNQSVGKGHTKWLGGSGCGPRAACCTSLVHSNGAQPAAVRPHAAFDNEICSRPHVI